MPAKQNLAPFGNLISKLSIILTIFGYVELVLCVLVLTTRYASSGPVQVAGPEGSMFNYILWQRSLEVHRQFAGVSLRTITWLNVFMFAGIPGRTFTRLADWRLLERCWLGHPLIWGCASFSRRAAAGFGCSLQTPYGRLFLGITIGSWFLLGPHQRRILERILKF